MLIKLMEFNNAYDINPSSGESNEMTEKQSCQMFTFTYGKCVKISIMSKVRKGSEFKIMQFSMSKHAFI